MENISCCSAIIVHITISGIMPRSVLTLRRNMNSEPSSHENLRDFNLRQSLWTNTQDRERLSISAPPLLRYWSYRLPFTLAGSFIHNVRNTLFGLLCQFLLLQLTNLIFESSDILGLSAWICRELEKVCQKLRPNHSKNRCPLPFLWPKFSQFLTGHHPCRHACSNACHQVCSHAVVRKLWSLHVVLSENFGKHSAWLILQLRTNIN